MRNVVVLPAPLGPSRPVISPSRAAKVTPSTAFTSPKALCRFLTSSIEIDLFVGGAEKAKAHPPRSPFVPKGEGKQAAPRALHPLPQEGGRCEASGGCRHGAAPLKLTNAGTGPTRFRHAASSCFGFSLSTNSSTSLGMQPIINSPWPMPLSDNTRPFERPFSTSSAKRGGVTGSRSPERISVGIDDLNGWWKSFGISPRGHIAH